MASPPPRQLARKQIVATLTYFDAFDYPLTASEIAYWSTSDTIRDSRKWETQGKYYFLAGRSQLVDLRRQRAKFSRSKWQIAREVGERLKQFPTLAAIFVTGALAMNNTPVDDDIDLMLVTYPHTLWLTRLVVIVYLNWFKLRRPPHLPYHSGPQVADKICDNLWLDLNHLAIDHRSLRTAHEVLQVKVVWDRAGVHPQFLTQNRWVKNYLPEAYQVLPARSKSLPNYFWLAPVNLAFFLVQYIYMWPHMTSERVGLGYAFFHPRPPASSSAV